MANLKPEALAYFAKRWGYNITASTTFDEVNEYLKKDTRTVGRRQYLNLYFKFVSLLEEVLAKEGSFRNIAPDFIENRWDILMGGRTDTIARAKLRDLLLLSDELRKKYPDLPEFKNHLIGTPYPAKVLREEGMVDDVFRGEAETVIPEVHDPLDEPEGEYEEEDGSEEDEDDEEGEYEEDEEGEYEDGEMEEENEMSTDSEATPSQQPQQAQTPTPIQAVPQPLPAVGGITPTTAQPPQQTRRAYTRKAPAGAQTAPGLPPEAGADPLDFLGSVQGPRAVVRRTDPAGSSFLTGHRVRVYREPSFPGEQEAFQGEYPSEQVASYGHGKGAVSIFLQQIVMRTYPPRPGDIQINYRIARVAPNGVEQPYNETLRLGVGVHSQFQQLPPTASMPQAPMPQGPGGYTMQPQATQDPMENFRKAQEHVREMEAEIEERQRAADEIAEERAAQIAAAKEQKDNAALEVFKQAAERERTMMAQHHAALEAARAQAEKARLEAERARMDARMAALEVPPPPPVVAPPSGGGMDRQVVNVLGGLVEKLASGGGFNGMSQSSQLSLMDIAKLQSDAEERRARMQAEADERADKRFQQMLSLMKPQGDSPEVTAMRIQMAKMEIQLQQATATKPPSETLSLLAATEALGKLGLKVGPGGGESFLGVAKSFFEHSDSVGGLLERLGWIKPVAASPPQAQAQAQPQAQAKPPPRPPSFIQNRAMDPNIVKQQEEKDRKTRESLPQNIRESIEALLQEPEEMMIPQRITDLFLVINEHADITEASNKERIARGETPVQNFMDQISKQLETLLQSGNVVGTNQYMRSVFAHLGFQQIATPSRVRKIVDVVMALMRSQPALAPADGENVEPAPPAQAAPPTQAAQPSPQAQKSPPPAAPTPPPEQPKKVTPAMRGKPLEVPR